MTMLETQIQTSRDYGREGGDRLSEGIGAILDGLQKGIDKVTGTQGNEIQTILSETAEVVNGLIPSKPTAASPKQEPGS
jgi:hypothetical protein